MLEVREETSTRLVLRSTRVSERLGMGVLAASIIAFVGTAFAPLCDMVVLAEWPQMIPLLLLALIAAALGGLFAFRPECWVFDASAGEVQVRRTLGRTWRMPLSSLSGVELQEYEQFYRRMALRAQDGHEFQLAAGSDPGVVTLAELLAKFLKLPLDVRHLA
jgi:hypothetical protein